MIKPASPHPPPATSTLEACEQRCTPIYTPKTQGIFALRIEDTDQNVTWKELWKVCKHLEIFGLHWDEEPLFQSRRTEIYMKYAKQLILKGAAYPCFCTSNASRKCAASSKQKLPPKYDRRCLGLSQKEIDELRKKGTPYVIRQQIPNKEITYTDLIRGPVTFHGDSVDDQVLIKSDGFPTYHLANVVDDHEMEVTHVIRGEEWLPSTPKHVWLYEAFGWQAPEFAHLPLLLNPDRSKLSKRQGDVAAEDFIKKGYLKEAMINFIAFLGWNPGTEEEIFTMEELIDRFYLDRVQKGGAVFNLEKLDWFNGAYIRKKSPEELGELILPYLQKEAWYEDRLVTQLRDEQKNARVTSVQSRMKTLADAPALLKPFLLDELDYDPKLFLNDKMKVDKAMAILALKILFRPGSP